MVDVCRDARRWIAQMALPPQARIVASLVKMWVDILYLVAYSLIINIIYNMVLTTHKDRDNFLSLQVPTIWDMHTVNFPTIGDCGSGNFGASLHYEN